MQRRSTIKKLISRVGFFFPANPYFLFFALGSWLSYGWLKSGTLIPGTPYYEIFSLLLQVTITFSFIILLYAFLSVVMAWFYFFFQKKKSAISLNITSSVQQENLLFIEVHPIIKPLLGFIKFRLRYNDGSYSPKFQLTQTTERARFVNTHLKGYYKWDLPEIQEYKIDEAIVFMEDVFQFFSLTVRIDTFERFTSVPETFDLDVKNPPPKQTENILSRIDVIKKVEGEYLNYKNFENDDIKRIVWKIYAKNRLLVVKTPEGLDPYSSHIYLFASFFTNYEIENNSTIQIAFLNYYKTMIWNIFYELKSNNPNIRFISDQSEKYIRSSDIDSDEKLKHLVSVSSWQKEINLKSYLNKQNPSIIIVSSLNNAKVINEIMRTSPKSTTFIFIPLSESLLRNKALDWLEFIFVKPDKNKLSKYKKQWAFSPIKKKIIKNEQAIKTAFATCDNAFVMTHVPNMLS